MPFETRRRTRVVEHAELDDIRIASGYGLGNGPRGTPQNRPMKVASKAANEHEAGQELLYLAGVVSGNSFS